MIPVPQSVVSASLLVLGGLLVAALPGCGGSEETAPDEASSSPARQTAFRVRSAIDAGLNADRGWAGPPNQAVTLPVEAPFRLRFEVGADAVAIGATVHVLFIEAGTGRLYHTRSDAPGAWSSPTVQVDSATVQWVRSQPVSTGGGAPTAYGYVYDAGSDGGSGRNWYGEVPVRE